ncbi:hypothetical protein ACFWN2_11790 [Lentzea sp. NPDC058436]|uniref:hypothetical protein n=1 Tax=Lentzea sp. NPDC058436 TaxID=3346499 RepID=UPI00364C4048
MALRLWGDVRARMELFQVLMCSCGAEPDHSEVIPVPLPAVIAGVAAVGAGVAKWSKTPQGKAFWSSVKMFAAYRMQREHPNAPGTSQFVQDATADFADNVASPIAQNVTGAVQEQYRHFRQDS